MSAALSSGDLAQIVRIARAGGDRLLGHFGRLGREDVRLKGPVDLVTRADTETEIFLREELAAAFPGVPFHGEEFGGSGAPGAGSAERWCVDPLDGTTNFVHGHPFFAVSIALVRDGEVAAGVVHAPLLGETFQAVRGAGARLGERPLAVSAASRLEESLLATGFASLRRPAGADNVPYFTHIVRRVEGIRRAGSAALDLCYVAAGRLDGYWEFNLSAWDVAAGSLLVQEAGGEVTDLAGGPAFLEGGAVVASNGRLQADLLSELARAGARDAAGG